MVATPVCIPKEFDSEEFVSLVDDVVVDRYFEEPRDFAGKDRSKAITTPNYGLGIVVDRKKRRLWEPGQPPTELTYHFTIYRVNPGLGPVGFVGIDESAVAPRNVLVQCFGNLIAHESLYPVAFRELGVPDEAEALEVLGLAEGSIQLVLEVVRLLALNELADGNRYCRREELFREVIA